jgi:hypothetical protein
MTKFTFTQAVEIPGRVLSAGTYWFVLQKALLKWYYPGRLTGHEFVYSARHEREFARDVKQDVLVEPDAFMPRL